MKSCSVFSNIKVNCFAVLAGIFCLFMGAGALAENKDSPCYEDVAKFCKDIEPGGGHIIQCINKHAADLSPACKDGMARVKKENDPQFQEACKDDKDDLCKGTKFGTGQVVQCLKKNEDDLSSECKEKIK
jgi:Cysteine rich repeat